MDEQRYDVVVVGSGAAGLTSALKASLEGLSVLVIEKARYYGGSTAFSGGVVWIPASHHLEKLSVNYFLPKVGIADTIEKGRAYMASVVGDRVTPERREMFLVDGPLMLRELEERTRWLRFRHWPFPDNYAEAPGGSSVGRTLEPEIVNVGPLGPERASLRPPTPALHVKGLTMTVRDALHATAGLRAWKVAASAARIAGQSLRSAVSRDERLAGGQALVARLRLALMDEGVPLWTSTPLRELITDGTGEGLRVTGVRAERDGRPFTIHAERGVVLAAGGFSGSQEMRERYLPSPTRVEWSLAPKDGQDGDGINAGLALGAAIELTNSPWGFPTVLLPLTDGAEPEPIMALIERTKPGVLIVNSAGERFANEGSSYVDFYDAMYAANAPGAETVPAWMIFDQRAKMHYPMFLTAQMQPFPRRWIDGEHILRAPTLEQLADRMGVPADGLQATVTRYNGFADRGHDDDFGKGDTAYERFWGDPSLPNPNLHPVGRAPFYAIRLYPGDICTKDGLAVDEHSQVLREDGSPIDGLFAAGNNSTSVMGATYPGGGASIAAAMVSGYTAAKCIASQRVSAESASVSSATD